MPFANEIESLHIAMVVRSFSERGGLELYAHRTIEGLLERGHKVTVVCEECDSNLAHKNLEKVFFKKSDGKVSKAVRIKQHFEAATKAVKESGPFDIVHSQHLPMEGADAVSFHNHTAYRLLEVGQNWEKLITQAKSLYSTAYKRRYEQDEILCRSPLLLFPAAVMRDDYRKTYNLDATHTAASYVVAYPGANFPKGTEPQGNATTQPLNKFKAQPFTFLFVGKGFRKKGLDILLAACQKLKNGNKNFRLHIAGLKAKPLDKARLATMGLSEHVTYLGFRKDMDVVYKEADAIILPSRIEPFGMSPIQGMLEGLVPIVSAVTGVSEVLSDGEDSLILKDHLSADELSSLMLKLMSDEVLAKRLSDKARQTGLKLTWDATVASTLSGYAALLSSQPAKSQI